MKRILTIVIVLSVLWTFFPAFSTPAAAAEASDEEFFSYLTERVQGFDESIDISDYARRNQWKLKDVSARLQKYYLLEPSLFFINNQRIPIEYNESKYLYIVKFDYLYSETCVKKMSDEMKKAALKAIEGITDDMSEAEKALAVHDYLVLNNSYDHTMKKYSAYNCLVERSSTCQGYTLAYVYIMRDLLGMECSVVISDSQNHSWNYLKVDGLWYHVDLTADDLTYTTYGGKEYDGFGEVNHKNLLLSDSACKKSTDLHRNWKTFDLPDAESTIYDDYFWKDCRSAMSYRNGLWYYVLTDPDSPGLNYKSGGDNEINAEIRSYNFSSEKSKLIKKIGSVWLVYRNAETGEKVTKNSWYRRSFTKIAVVGDDLYYHTADKIYRFNLKTGETKRVYTLKKNKMSIYGIVATSEGKLRVCYKYDLSYSDKYFQLNIS
ncbi:MAG: hypothetical protein NC084_06490 [Bacteroides sp.]|nr:hypothetical protein [Eubacterium sp.]MCM1418271.1 hypothetical protein [Roseburia sp.]MCM1462346.1 hypothetical protein [Bacteroides sp.]